MGLRFAIPPNSGSPRKIMVQEDSQDIYMLSPDDHDAGYTPSPIDVEAETTDPKVPATDDSPVFVGSPDDDNSSSSTPPPSSNIPSSKPKKGGSDMKSLMVATGIAGVAAVGYLFVYPMIAGEHKPAQNATANVPILASHSAPEPLVDHAKDAHTVSNPFATPAVKTSVKPADKNSTLTLAAPTSSPVVVPTGKTSSAVSSLTLGAPATVATSSTPALKTVPDLAAPTSTAKTSDVTNLPLATPVTKQATQPVTSSVKSAPVKTVSTGYAHTMNGAPVNSPTTLTLTHSDITSLEKSVHSVQKDYTHLNAKVNRLSQSVQSIKRADVSHVAPRAAPVYHPVYHRPVYVAPAYTPPPAPAVPKKHYVKGGVGNGMALINENGNTKMIGVGSYYPGLGTVTRIKSNGEIIGTKGTEYVR